MASPPPVPIPPALTDAGPEGLGAPIVVLGAGCAGLTLAVSLVRDGCDRPIVLVDSRTGYTDDRTWSFWSADGDPVNELATAAWSGWTVRTGGQEVRRHHRGTAYRRIRGRDFYAAALTELARHPRVRLRLGEPVLALERRADGPPIVRTTRDRLVPHVLVDCRGPRMTTADVAEARRAGVWLGQEFLGLRVRAQRPAFDASAAVLLDFRMPQHDGTRFAYMLPSSPTEALVESVRFADTARIDAETHRRLLGEHLQRSHGLGPGEFEVLGEERGLIPMTDAGPTAVVGERHYALGLAGGAARPSTGYAFLRIHRSAHEVAAAILEQREPAVELDGRRRRLLDAVFLRFLAAQPHRVPTVFGRMFGRTPPGALLRFLCDTSTPLDELLLIAALPKAPFLAILVRMVAARAVRALLPVRRTPLPRVVPRRLV